MRKLTYRKGPRTKAWGSVPFRDNSRLRRRGIDVGGNLSNCDVSEAKRKKYFTLEKPALSITTERKRDRTLK